MFKSAFHQVNRHSPCSKIGISPVADICSFYRFDEATAIQNSFFGEPDHNIVGSMSGAWKKSLNFCCSQVKYGIVIKHKFRLRFAAFFTYFPCKRKCKWQFPSFYNNPILLYGRHVNALKSPILQVNENVFEWNQAKAGIALYPMECRSEEHT